MKALTVDTWWAMKFLMGEKTIEVRSWTRDYRGPVVICSNAKKYPGLISGHALCVGELVDIVPLQKKHLKAAGMNAQDWSELKDQKLYAWIFENIKIIEPQKVKGQLGLWKYKNKINILDFEEGSPEADAAYEKYFEPLLHLRQ